MQTSGAIAPRDREVHIQSSSPVRKRSDDRIASDLRDSVDGSAAHPRHPHGTSHEEAAEPPSRRRGDQPEPPPGAWNPDFPPP